MTCKPTLHCQCNGDFLEEIYTYDSPPEGETNFDIDPNRYKRAYDKCSSCGHFFARHNIDLEELYENNYVTSTYGSIEGMQEKLEKVLGLPKNKSDNFWRVKRIRDYSRRKFSKRIINIKLLDVGAGIGVFPAAIKRNGWEVHGVEPDSRTATHLRENVEIKAYENLSQINPEESGRFNIITFNKVLEHVEDPVRMLKSCDHLIDDNAFIYVELPDTSASLEGKEREEFFIEHYHIFTLESCSFLAERANYIVTESKRIREPSSKYTLYAFLEKINSM